VKKITGWSGRVAGAAVIAAIVAGCGIASPASKSATGPPERVTENIAPSALVVVVDGRVAGRTVSGLVSATARPQEDLDILQAGARPHLLLAASSPRPAAVVVAGKPVAPGPGATAYLWAGYRKDLRTWQNQKSAGKREVAARTHAATSARAHRLPIPAAVTGTTGAGGYRSVPADPDSLATGSNLAASAVAGLDQEAGDRFGGRRVIVLYVPNLRGIPREAALTGDDVIVVTSYLPTVARASAAQAKLLDAGAVHATVLGPETTPAQLAQLVTAGLSQKASTETLSGSVLFAGGSSALLPGAARVLTPLLAALRRPGAVGVVNGYAYTAGSIGRDNKLALARAAAVARYLENRGIPASSLIVVGHGLGRLVTTRSSGAGSRVVVVVEEPAIASS